MDTNALEKLIGTERDSALLRMSLAKALAEEDRLEDAEAQLAEATRMEASYTAAWKELGKLRLALENPDGAREAWQSGLDAARDNGDKQAEKEMTVFLRRLNNPGQ